MIEGGEGEGEETLWEYLLVRDFAQHAMCDVPESYIESLLDRPRHVLINLFPVVVQDQIHIIA